jgi:hypothetical protein
LYIIIPLFILIILPFSLIFSEILYIETEAGYPIYLKYFEITVVTIIIIYILLSIYEKYWKKNEINLVKEFEFLKKLMYIGLPLLIIVMLAFINTNNPVNPNWSYPLFSGLILIVSSTLSKIILSVLKRDFRFYYAKGCFSFLMKRKDDSEKMRYLVMGINSYNKYLKKNLKLQINNINNLHSKLISNFILHNSLFVDSLSKTFHTDNKLLPLSYIIDFLNLETEQFLIEESLWEKIKDWGAFLVAVVPVVISIIQFITNANSK